MSGRREETALGVARARFVEGLPRRTRELKGAIALLTASPGDARAREELRRRLHALFASAQVFRIERLADGLKACIATLDAAREGQRSLTDGELEELTRVSLALPDLAATAEREGASIAAPPSPETVRAPEPLSDLDIVTTLPAEATSGYRVPTVESFAPAKPAPSEKKSLEEAVLRLATIDGATAKNAPRTDDPFDAAVTTPGIVGAANEGKGVSPLAVTPAPAPAAAVTSTPAPAVAVTPAPAPAAPVTSLPTSTARPMATPGATSTSRPIPTPSAAPAKRAADSARFTVPTPRANPASRLPLPNRPVVAPLPPSSSTAAAKRTSARPVPKPAGSAAIGLPTVVSVLVVDDAQSLAQIREALPAERFEVLTATDPEEALRLARTAAPDVVLASRTVADLREIDFITRLRSDPLNGDVPLVLLHPAGRPLAADDVKSAGADDAVATPIDPDVLAAKIATLCGLDGQGAGIGRLGDMTVAAVADRIAEEIRRGLADAVEDGSDVAVPLGVGSEVLAAAWSTIARVRAHVYEASHGRVRFRDLPRRGAPTIVGIVDGLDQEGEGPEISLAGRKLLIADDDPAVLWFFSQVLKEAGAEVLEAGDGLEALELARRARPDVVLSDILMPRMDGMALCRELARDPALGATPVILLSWKEDFLQRMRELRAGAHGYLRKEEGTAQILRRVREALRPRANLERMLRTGGEVRGRIEQIGVVPLLRALARERPDARLTVRDAHSLFEVDFRGGGIVDVTRTAADGGFARGARALPLLVGVADGRFTIVDSDATVRPTIEGSLDSALDEVCAKLGAMIDAVSGAGLGRAAQMELDPDALEALVASSPGRAGEIAEKLRAGMSPPELLLSGGVEPQLLESILIDLARRGGVRRVAGASGEDRIAEALAQRLRGLEATPKPAAATSTDPPPGTEWLREAARSSDASEPPPRASDANDLVGSIASNSDDLDLVVPVEEEAGAATHADSVAALRPAGSLPAPVKPQAVIPQPPRVATAHRSRGVQLAAWGAFLAVLGGVGYFATRSAQDAIQGDSAGEAPAAAGVHHASTTPGVAPAEPPSEQPPEAPAHVAEGESRLYGRALPTIVSEQTSVAEGQGLLRVEADGSREGVQLLIGDRPVGAPPLDIALDEGVHELAFRSGDDLRYRYVYIRAGESRVVPAP